MDRLYQGCLPHKFAQPALQELKAAQIELSKLPPSDVVWDYEDPSSQPPWGENIAETITSLGNYFLTSDGRDFFEVFKEALETAESEKSDVTIG